MTVYEGKYGYKFCTECGTFLNIGDNFHKNGLHVPSGKQKYASHCKTCTIEINKVKNKSPERKNWRKEYRRTEKFKTYQRNKNNKYTDELSDRYIKAQLKKSYGLSNPSQACIELKRTQLKEFRLIQKLRKNEN